MSINVMTNDEINEVSGAFSDTNWNETFLGLGAAAIGLGIAATPVGWFGIGIATALTYGGANVFADGLWNGGYIWGEGF